MSKTTISVDERTHRRFITAKGLFQSMQKKESAAEVDSNVFLNALLEMYEISAEAARSMGLIMK